MQGVEAICEMDSMYKGKVTETTVTIKGEVDLMQSEMYRLSEDTKSLKETNQLLDQKIKDECTALHEDIDKVDKKCEKYNRDCRLGLTAARVSFSTLSTRIKRLNRVVAAGVIVSILQWIAIILLIIFK